MKRKIIYPKKKRNYLEMSSKYSQPPSFINKYFKKRKKF